MQPLSSLLALPACALLMLGLTRRIWPGDDRRFRSTITLLAGIQALLAALTTIAYGLGMLGKIDIQLWQLSSDSPIAIGILMDGVSGLMWTLVSFVGWIICRYSIRYLDGESAQGKYFGWTGFVIGAVSLLVLAANLLMFVFFWSLISLGLHQLLLHYGHRPAARRAAWTKFVVSRIGDAALLGGVAVLFSKFGTLRFTELFAAASTVEPDMSFHVAAALLVVGAITKSAQVPFHTWMPLTMETPTPVSALMHAGIVNAGGYLIIRTSPLMALSPTVLSVLAVIGAITACFAAVVMLTQTSIKKSLAYSTIAQMGFMMLQCGLGAFSAAMLHILAHSLYKAHAFLSSGGVLASNRPNTEPSKTLSLIPTATLGGVLFFAIAIAFLLVGIDAASKPGAILLGSILWLGLFQWTYRALGTGNTAVVSWSLAGAFGLSLIYAGSYQFVDGFVAASVPVSATASATLVASALIVVAFLSAFALQVAIQRRPTAPWLTRFYVHASNGFYVENALRRTIVSLASN